MPSAPIVTCARIFPLLAAVTPRSRYLKKERRPATSGAVVGVAYASLPGALTVPGCPIGVVASFIMEASSELLRRRLHGRVSEFLGGRPSDRGPFEEPRVLRPPQMHGVGEREVAEVVVADQAILDELEGLGQWMPHVDHVEVPDVRAVDGVQL